MEFGPNFAKTVREYVKNSGMLQASMNTSRVAMQRMGTVFQLNVLEAFDSGAESGLASFFNSMSDSMKDSAPIFRFLGRLVGGLASFAGIIVRIATQIARPFQMFLDSITSGFDSGSESGMNFIDVLKMMAAVLLIPFAWLEELNNELEKTDGILAGIAKGGLGVLSAGIGYLLLRLFRVPTAIAGIVSGVTLLSKAFGALVFVGKALLFTPIGRLIMLGTAALAGVSAAMSYFGDEDEPVAKAVETANRSKMSTTSSSKSVSIGDTKFEIYSNDPEETGRIVQSKMDERFDMIFTSSMVGG